MRRSLFGLLTVVAIAGLLLTTGCERSSVLRVVQINEGRTLQSDLADFAVYKDPTDPEAEPELIWRTPTDSVSVELQYVEIGAGLPTWTPYEAIINRLTVTYVSKGAEPRSYTAAVMPITTSIMADREGKKTRKFTTTVASTSWKENAFPGEAEEDPTFFDVIDVVEATLKFAGWDSVSLRTVEASGKLFIEFGNFPDDENTFGK